MSIKKISKTEALLRLQNLCSRNEKSEYELRKKLELWGHKYEADAIIQQLKKDDFLNPLRFARAFIHDKIRLNKWGKTKIRYQLIGHHIPADIIENLLSEYDEESYIEMVHSELMKKDNSIRETNPFKRKTKLFAFGNQRGYESSIIREFLDDED